VLWGFLATNYSIGKATKITKITVSILNREEKKRESRNNGGGNSSGGSG